MNSKYYRLFDYPIWKQHQHQLLDYKNLNVPVDQAWYGFNKSEFGPGLSDVIKDLETLGINVNQIIFISFPPTDLNSTDLNDSKTVYIHVDHRDDEQHLSLDIAPTRFVPKYVLNIPLVNCEQSYTFFYEFIDPDKNTSDQHTWGGGCVDYTNVEKVDEFQLTSPAFLKVDVPHAVHNPTKDLRIVCSIRVDDQSPILKEMFNF